MKNTLPRTGTKWWPMLGYSRAVTHGRLVHVAATVATEALDGLAGDDGPQAQAEQAFRNLERALAAFGASLEQVVRTRVFVADLLHWPPIAKAYEAVFAAPGPHNSVIGTRRFDCCSSLVEIEAEALIQRRRPPRRASVPQPPSTPAQDTV